MKARTLMVQGTGSSVGKSVLVAALCRILRQDGYRVAPFKSQNMALNSFVTPEGGEIGRAQAVQAEAAGIEPAVDMNPILIKPEADARAQVVVLGRPALTVSAGEYYRHTPHLLSVALASLERLRSAYDVVVIEGAGSPAEINLKQSEIVNMRIAREAGSPVLLVGDIDKGGVFASLVGTLALLDEEERELVKGFIINKFRGDIALLKPGLDFLEKHTSRPVLGVVPFYHHILIPEEDSVYEFDQAPAKLSCPPRVGARGKLRRASRRGRGSRFPGFLACAGNDKKEGNNLPISGLRGSLFDNPPLQKRDSRVDIAVVHLPHISNSTDFEPLQQERGVRLRYVSAPEELGMPDALIIPGSKVTVSDLLHLRETGMAKAIMKLAEARVPVVGICGGFQMMGRWIEDPLGIESPAGRVAGLGLLDVVSVFAPAKTTWQVKARVEAKEGLFRGMFGEEVCGYEIHMGQSTLKEEAPFRILERGSTPCDVPDGAVNSGGTVFGTYIHGLFDNPRFRASFVSQLRERKGLGPWKGSNVPSREQHYEELAKLVRRSLDIEQVYRICGLGVPQDV